MRGQTAVALGFILCGACASARGSDDRASSPEASLGSSRLVLYSDKALLQYRARASFDDRGVAQLSDVPVGEHTEVRVVGGAALASEHALGVARGSQPWSALIGARVRALTESGSVEGKLVDWNYRGLTVATETGLALITDPIVGLEIFEPPGSLLPGELTVRGGKGETNLEVKTWLTGLSWRVAYTVVLDGLDATTARVQGWLAIDSSIAQAFEVDQVAIADGRANLDRGLTDRSSSAKPTVTRTPPRVPIVGIGRGARLKAGGSVRLPLLAGDRLTPVELARVFDPVGASHSHQGVRPIDRRSYATTSDNKDLPVSLTVRLGLSEDQLRGLPVGDISVLVRSGGTMSALGSTRGFGRPAEPNDDSMGSETVAIAQTDGTTAGPGDLRIGVAPGLRGRRWQADFHLDKAHKRLVEEIRVELKNDTATTATVIVYEHLYRGLSWSLAYHNEVGVASKKASQEIDFSVVVPARGKRVLMYRVVYTW